MKMSIVIFDLDGTLALIEHRRHFVENGNKQWDEFHAACVDDKPNLPVMMVWEALVQAGHDMFIFSGRSDQVRSETEAWLDLWDIVPDQLYMRKAGDHQPDVKLKLSWLCNMTATERMGILCVFDDRSRVVDMWRINNIVCCQVAEGNF